MIRRANIAALGLSLLAQPALASEGGGGLMDFAFQTGNLLLLIGVLVYFGRKPIQKFFADRRNQIKGDLEEAAGLLEAAESRYADWQRKLIDLEQEMESIRSEGRRRAEEEGEAILAEAQAAAERIRRDAKTSVEQELRRAQVRLRTEAAEIATQMAEEILKQRVGDPDLQRLMDEFITRVESREQREEN